MSTSLYAVEQQRRESMRNALLASFEKDEKANVTQYLIAYRENEVVHEQTKATLKKFRNIMERRYHLTSLDTILYPESVFATQC